MAFDPYRVDQFYYLSLCTFMWFNGPRVNKGTRAAPHTWGGLIRGLYSVGFISASCIQSSLLWNCVTSLAAFGLTYWWKVRRKDTRETLTPIFFCSSPIRSDSQHTPYIHIIHIVPISSLYSLSFVQNFKLDITKLLPLVSKNTLSENQKCRTCSHTCIPFVYGFPLFLGVSLNARARRLCFLLWPLQKKIPWGSPAFLSSLPTDR